MKSNMFGQKTLNELCKNIVLSVEQKNAAKHWLNLLLNGRLESETKNYTKFQQYILQDVLGYNIDFIHPEENKADFQIRTPKNDTILCIESKGTKTKNLFARQGRAKREQETPIEQLWNQMAKCGSKYGMCTNYKNFILLQQGNDQYYEFDFLRAKNDEALKEFILIFSKSGIPNVEQTIDDSIKEEKTFTNEFYNLFHETRLMLVHELQINGMDLKRSVYFTQIILNRLTFVFFAEDKKFITPHSSKNRSKILHDIILNELNSPLSVNSHLVYSAINRLFQKLDDGTDPGIFGFNGGMFSGTLPNMVFFNDLRDKTFFNDDIKQNSKLLQSTKLNDYDKQIISKIKNLNPIIYNILIMERFDFNIDIDVSILGHIFEQSISDLEILVNTGRSERKEGGIYYTPDNVTKYICRNTIIPYLSKMHNVNKPKELVEEYFLNDDLDTLEKKLSELKILDPACGSGAFLVKVAETMYEIYDEIQSYRQMTGDLQGWSEDERIRNIILNNIYGVDINNRSIDIAKLSLFFKMTTKGKKLPDLSNNLKNGNSILPLETLNPIKDSFDWKKQFPNIMENDKGFDIIVGNPPYVRQESLNADYKKQLQISGKKISTKMDLSGYFYFRSVQYLKKNGVIGFISSDSWLHMGYGKSLQKLFLENKIRSILKPSFSIFEDANIKASIIIFEKNYDNKHNVVQLITANNKSDLIKKSSNIIQKQQVDFKIGNWNNYFDDHNYKINIDTIPLEKLGKIKRGKTTGDNKFFIIDEQVMKKYKIDKKYVVPMPDGISTVNLKVSNPKKYLLNVNEPKGVLLGSKIGEYVWKYIDEKSNEMIVPKKGHDVRKRKRCELSSVSNRNLWYSLNLKDTAPILLGRFIDKFVKIYENDGSYFISDNFAYFTPDEIKYMYSFLAYMSSSLFALDMEKNGHSAGAGALQFLINDYKKIRVPNFTKLDLHHIAKLNTAWGIYKNDLNREKLDLVVFTIFGINEYKTKIIGDLESYTHRRLNVNKK